MRSILFGAAASCIFLLCSCNDSVKVAGESKDSEIEKNKAASKTISDAFSTGDVSKIDSVVAEDFLDHTDRGDIRGRDSLKAMIKMVHDNFGDMKMEVLHELADKDYVYTLMRFTGVSDGTMGMPKGPYDMKAIQVGRYKDGKALEHWEYMETREIMKMMQMGPGMGEMKKDTTTMKK